MRVLSAEITSAKEGSAGYEAEVKKKREKLAKEEAALAKVRAYKYHICTGSTEATLTSVSKLPV